MTSSQHDQTKLIEQARVLLSPYMDDEVTVAERTLVEAMLSQSPELQAELESLRQTVALVKELPRMSAPRPFTLSEADLGLGSDETVKPSFIQIWLKPLMGAAAALTAVIIVGAIIFGLSSPPAQEANFVARAPAQEAAPAEGAPLQPLPTATIVEEVGLEREVIVEKEVAVEAAESAEIEITAAVEAAQTEGLADSVEIDDVDSEVVGAGAEEPAREEQEGLSDLQVLPTPSPAALAPPAAAMEKSIDTAAVAESAAEPGVTTEALLEEAEAAPATEFAFDVPADEHESSPITPTAIGQNRQETAPQSTATQIAEPTLQAVPQATVEPASETPPVAITPALSASQPDANRIFLVWVCTPAIALIGLGLLIVIVVFTRKPKSNRE